MGLCRALVSVHVVLVLVLAEHRARFAVLAGRAWLLTTVGPLKEIRKTRNGKRAKQINQALGRRVWARLLMTRRSVLYDFRLGNQAIAGCLPLCDFEAESNQIPPSKIWALPPALHALRH
jgi:hypothetical protein